MEFAEEKEMLANCELLTLVVVFNGARPELNQGVCGLAGSGPEMCGMVGSGPEVRVVSRVGPNERGVVGSGPAVRGVVGSRLEARVVVGAEPEECVVVGVVPEERVVAVVVPEERVVGSSEPGVHREAGPGPEVHEMASRCKACIGVKLDRFGEIWAGVQCGGAAVEGRRGSAGVSGLPRAREVGLVAGVMVGSAGLGWRRRGRGMAAQQHGGG